MMNTNDNRARDIFARNRDEIDRANIHLIKRFVLCIFINMFALSVVGPFMESFQQSKNLYVGSAALAASFGLYCIFFMDRFPRTVRPLFYVLLAFVCAYGVILSTYYYPDIHGVTIVALFVLMPILILDRSWRVNLIMFAYYAAACAFTFWRKPSALAVDDCLTSGYFLVFGGMIANYLRAARIASIDRQRILALQQEQLKYQKSVDELTSLPNRRSLFETLAEDEANANMGITGMIMIDIDDFKIYNDTHGHLAGDNCLRAAGVTLACLSAGNGMRTFRYGGEEFLVLSAARNEDALKAQAEMIVESAAHLALDHAGITLSAGYAYRGENTGITNEQLISMADSALYMAKSEGKNRTMGYRGVCDITLSETLRKRK